MSQLPNKPKYDLEERTKKFGEDVIKFCQKIPRGPITNPLIGQVVKAGTSVGANYCEADNAESKQDFRHKIAICKKEAKESRHFIWMIIIAVPGLKVAAAAILQEAKELTLIFGKIYKKLL